ncbi:fungal-specific transcription factor domain-containing protein [Boeremia exigua]|uniref:fungal-specific transcription factor domain-containing protein n=1 Tax=Boeremia exigua TaxID=749465 RepID=UPI001E8EB813|nr:fungal-specific transcription factor domain-containing protein [Boeremia exigua]KAH6619910.1 fungal-specific transcription factor domain-containing protein [Boeremia exigua]
MARSSSASPQISSTLRQDRPETQTGLESRPARVRTAKACRFCNAKRVKCDASERGTPCTRCEQRGEPNCTLIQSRRGIYVRKPRQQQVRTRGVVAESSGAPANEDRVNAGDPPVAQNSNVQTSTPALGIQSARSSTAPASVQPQHDTPSGATDVSTDSRQHDASWSTMFEGVLNRHDQRAAVDKRTIAYVGEAFPLNIILDGARGGTGRPVLHHSGPTHTPATTHAPSQAAHPTEIPPEEISYLEAKQAFTAPPDAILDVLITVFMERVFPLYPVINPREFLEHQKSGTLPWMLLHSVCFMAATFCPLRTLHQAGFQDRKQARYRFYSKAKALFDVGYESSKIVTLQATILLSFWGGSPNNHWNFYTWISTGVTVAETIGCHRSMTGLNIAPQDRSLLKRLWWTLLVRDATCASMHGRPFRINLEHCDVDELTMEDFEYEGSFSSDHLSQATFRLSGLYQVQVVKLALLLRQIVTIRFYPRSQTGDTTSLLQQLLLHWRNGLPASLQWADNDITHVDVFRTTLRILYNHNVILSHIKPESVTDSKNPHSPSSWLGDEVASLSAQQTASLACSMVTASEELVPPHELFHGLFMACVVFFVQSRSSDSMTASLGRFALTNCKMALHAHRETWDASSWITQLFDKALAHPVRRLDAAHSDPTPNAQTTFNNLDVLETSGLFLDGMEGWPNHLFLGDLFGTSVDNTAFVPPLSDFPQNFTTQLP